MRHIFTLLLVSAGVLTLPAAQCDPSAVTISGGVRSRVSVSNGPLALVNTSGKTIVNYVLVDSSQRAADGTSRIYTGKFSGGDGLQTGKSISFGSGSPSQITIDYVRFADGCPCRNGTTKEAKAAGAH